MPRTNWHRDNQRRLMQKRGTVPATEIDVMMAPLIHHKPRRRPLSKAELRRMAAEAIANTPNLTVKKF